MTTFSGFDQAARLYAEHAALLDGMRDSYRGQAALLLEALEEAIGRELGTVEFRAYLASGGSGGRYWWTGERDWQEGPCLWFQPGSPAHVNPAGLWLLLYTPGPRERVRAIDFGEGAAVTYPEKKGPAAEITIAMAAEDPVPEAARRVARVLRLLQSAFPEST